MTPEESLKRLRTSVRQGLSFAINVVADNDLPANTESIRESLFEWDLEVKASINELIDVLIEEQAEELESKKIDEMGEHYGEN
jgi:hypothetical protein